MKKDIHPEYYDNAKITCACGAVYTVGSTIKEMQVELCSACHPFYTGKQKLVDTARRVEKFQEKMTQKEAISKTRKGKKVKRATRAAKKESDKNPTATAKKKTKKPIAKKQVKKSTAKTPKKEK